mgnify:CR=1 FL=1
MLPGFEEMIGNLCGGNFHQILGQTQLVAAGDFRGQMFQDGLKDGHRQSAMERPRLELELQMRCVRHIAERITELLSTHPGGWALADRKSVV